MKKTGRLTKDGLTKMFIKSNENMIKYISSLDSTLKALNDNNLLHTTAINESTKQQVEMIATTKEVIKSNNRFQKVISGILVVLVAAIIILAGAEKALKFLPTI